LTLGSGATKGLVSAPKAATGFGKMLSADSAASRVPLPLPLLIAVSVST
jgi:hypothetical protein